MAQTQVKSNHDEDSNWWKEAMEKINKLKREIVKNCKICLGIGCKHCQK